MKKIFIIIISILFSVLIFSACEKEVITYKDGGIITISIKNSEIDIDDVKVFVTDENASWDVSGDKIVITKDNMLRTMITLSCEGYQNKNVVVKSTDFGEARAAVLEVKFDEAYTLLDVEVITNASSKRVNVEGEDILSKTRDGKTLHIKLKSGATPLLKISAGEGYDSYDLQIVANDIISGICMKTVLLKSKSNALVQLNLDSDIYVDFNSELNNYYKAYKSGTITMFEINKNDTVKFFYRRNVAGNPPIYEGEALVTPADMISNDIFTFTLENSLYILHYNIINYQYSSWHVICEKTGENTYNPVKYQSYSYDNYTFQRNKTYTVFAMSGDGKIRYKDIDFKNIEHQGFTVTFVAEDPVLEVKVKLIDIQGKITSFNNIKVSTYSPFNDIGVINGSNEMQLNNINFSYNQLAAQDAENNPNNFVSVNDGYLVELENTIKKLVKDGTYELYVYKPFDLRVNFISNVSQSFNTWTVQHNYYENFTVDESNSVLIENYAPNDNYIFGNRNLNSLFELNDIKTDEFGNYYVDVVIEETLS